MLYNVKTPIIIVHFPGMFFSYRFTLILKKTHVSYILASVLIPKVPHPKNLKDIRPIRLSNMVYKIVSKFLVNRLRPILGDLISEK